MRLSHRLIGSLVLGVGLVSLIFAWSDIRGRERQLRADMAGRATAEIRTLDQTLVAAGDGRRDKVQSAIDRFRARTQAVGVLVYDEALNPAATSSGLPEAVLTVAHELAVRAEKDGSTAEIISADDRDLFVEVEPVTDLTDLGAIAVVHDATSIHRQSIDAWKQQAIRLLAQIGLVVVVTFLLVRWSFVRPIARTAAWLRELRTVGSSAAAPLGEGELFKPLAREVTHLVQSLETARAAALEEARLRDAGASVWTAERLRAHVRDRVGASPVFVVSNREPYMHVRQGGGPPTVVVPASGLVTALEPVLRACAGTWIAHGSGDADRDTVDARDRLRVPPEQPEYTLRRVWLTKEEEQGHYDGFSNEGLWPLCHIAHTRPIFRGTDWSCYREANQKFADALLEEARDSLRPLVLVQDYHFALLPRLVKAARPDARVAIFWHIPWPNPEAFGICPWQSELLDGLLGADLVGFHTQAHCNNFLDTVERGLESQIDWEHFTARRHNRLTHVRPFPISVAARPIAAGGGLTVDAARETVFRQIGVSSEFIGVGVDRVDYTKGLIERFRGIERFFEKWSHYLRRFTFVQIGAPSRTGLGRYRDLLHDVQAEAARINARFGTAVWKPIVLLTRHHGHEEIEPFYRAADVCAVTSLHDGMNLVAKEFISARDDGEGTLILSRFTGAARELGDALIVNPYDSEQLADAFRRSLEMGGQERRARMERMRRIVAEQNVYRWAATLIGDLAALRVDAPASRPRLAAPRRLAAGEEPFAETDSVA